MFGAQWQKIKTGDGLRTGREVYCVLTIFSVSPLPSVEEAGAAPAGFKSCSAGPEKALEEIYFKAIIASVNYGISVWGIFPLPAINLLNTGPPVLHTTSNHGWQMTTVSLNLTEPLVFGTRMSNDVFEK